MPAKKKPTGVVIVGALYLVMAILALVAALGFLQWAGLPHDELVSQNPNAPFWLVGGGSIVLTALGLIVFLVAVVDLIMAVGCFRGWGWVWNYALVFAVINIALSMFNALGQGLTITAVYAGIIGALVPIVILVYLSTGKVRKYFGKA
jgi:hypothetical protein